MCSKPLANSVIKLWCLEPGSNLKKKKKKNPAEVQVDVKKLNFNSKVLKKYIGIRLQISKGFLIDRD